MNFLSAKLLSKPQAPYLVALNTPSSVAIWPLSSKKITASDESDLVDFSIALSGVEMDESMALKVETNRVQNILNKAKVLNGDDNLEMWESWQLDGDNSRNPFGSIDLNSYRKFLINQNTLSSLEEILYSYPMDKEVLALYAKKLLEASKNEELKTTTRNRYRVSAAWYDSASK